MKGFRGESTVLISEICGNRIWGSGSPNTYSDIRFEIQRKFNSFLKRKSICNSLQLNATYNEKDGKYKTSLALVPKRVHSQGFRARDHFSPTSVTFLTRARTRTTKTRNAYRSTFPMPQAVVVWKPEGSEAMNFQLLSQLTAHERCNNLLKLYATSFSGFAILFFFAFLYFCDKWRFAF